ncbi:MAG: AI-2E family transporter [Planctomycetes bacterium]|nr:AI-2E family transporter [Planctomycetota bacterium]MCB9918116.1 AI-2E family transporter [Planctomycetota bacterium]
MTPSVTVDSVPDTPGDDARSLSGWERRRVLVLLAFSLLFLLISGYWLREVVGPLVVAVGLAYVLDPIVHVLTHRFRMPRGLAVFTVFLVFLAGAGGAVWFLVEQSIDFYEAAFGDGGFIEDLPRDAYAFAQNLPKWVPGRETLLDVFGGADSNQPIEFPPMRGTARDLEAAIVAVAKALGTIFTLLSLVVLVPIYLYYFMLDLPRLWAWFQAHTPKSYQPRVFGVLSKIHEGLSAFLRGRVVIAILKGLLTSVGLWLVGLPYAFAVGMFSGLLSILPFIGAGLGLLVSVALVLVSKLGAASLVWVLAVFLIAEIIEGYVFYPWILSGRLDMHPVTMLFSVVLWGSVFGIFGVLVAIPLTIVVRAIVRDVLLDPLETLATDGEA